MPKFVESDHHIAHIIRDTTHNFWSGLWRPAHERYGYGTLPVGESIQIDLTQVSSKYQNVVRNIHSHGQINGRKYKTKKIDDTLHVMRIQ